MHYTAIIVHPDRLTQAPVAVLIVGGALAGLGSVRLTWSFSAFTVLIYYAITNLAALRLGRAERLFSPVFPVCGLVACLGLAFWVEWRIWLSGLALIALGLAWHRLRWYLGGSG